jgi:hypothetical protein
MVLTSRTRHIVDVVIVVVVPGNEWGTFVRRCHAVLFLFYFYTCTRTLDEKGGAGGQEGGGVNGMICAPRGAGGGREEGGTIGPVELSPPERRIVATTVYRYLLLYVWMGAVASDCAAHDDAAHDDAERFGFTTGGGSRDGLSIII